MKQFKHISIACLFIVVSVLNTFAAKEIDLSYKLEKGKKYQLDITNRQTINMNMAGNIMSLVQNVTINQDVEIINKSEENNYTLNLTYTRIQFNQNAMGMEIQWDSENPETNNPMVQQIANSFSKSIGTAITTIIDPTGMPISNNKSEVLEESASISGFESGMMIVYADKKVKAGDTWEVSLKPDPKSDFVITSEYTLDEIKGKIAKISFKGTIVGSQIMGEKAVIKGVISGKTEVEIATGWIVSASISQDMEMEMEQQGTTIPMQMNSFIEMSSKSE